MNKPTYVLPELCPLCSQKNYCGNLEGNNSASNANKNACWCMKSDMSFSSALLSKVSDAALNKACICEACARSQQTPFTKK